MASALNHSPPKTDPPSKNSSSIGGLKDRKMAHFKTHDLKTEHIKTAPKLIQVKEVKTGIQPKSVSVSPDGKRVFVAIFGKPDKDNVEAYDAQTLQKIGTVSFEGNACEQAFSPDGRRLYVSNFRRHRIEVIDPVKLTVIQEIPVGAHPKTIAPSPDGKRLYVANWGDDTVSVVDLQAGLVIETLKTKVHPRGMVATKDHRLLVASFTKNTLQVFDTQTLKLKRNVRICHWPRHLILSPDEQTLYVSNAGHKKIHTYDAHTFEQLHWTRTGFNPRTLGISTCGTWIASADFNADAVTLLNTQTQSHHTSPIKTAHKVVGLAIHPGENLRIFVTGWLNGALHVLEPQVLNQKSI